jgi:hypothetical protein
MHNGVEVGTAEIVSTDPVTIRAENATSTANVHNSVSTFATEASLVPVTLSATVASELVFESSTAV